MSYSVRLNDESKRKLNAWKLSSHAIREVFRALDGLGSNPSRQLIRVLPPDDALQYDLVIRDPGDPDHDQMISFTVRYSTDEETLIVVECDRLIEDRPG